MYGAMREHARNRPMQIVGLGVSAAVTAGAASLLMNGFGDFVGAFTPPPPATLTLTPEDRTEPPPLEKIDLPNSVSPFERVEPLPLPDEWFVIPPKTDEGIIVDGGGTTGGGEPKAATAPARSVRMPPKLRSPEKPPYPATEVRARTEGDTSLGLCIDARGRVTSASLVTSSGHPRLDEAALKWVRTARFSPGTLNGAAQAVCGHTVVYEWRLVDAR